MRYGLAIWLDQPLDPLAELAVGAEQAGFADVWLPDHYFLRDVYVAQAIIAARTSTLRLATGVAAVQLRHPALIASSAATIAERSGGRAVIGIGPGGHEFPSQFEMRPPSPLRMLRQAVQIIRELSSGQAGVRGEYFSADGAALGWRIDPPPIYLSARGPRMLELAGEIADGVIIHGVQREFLDYARARVVRGAERAGRDPQACEIAVMLDVEIDADEAAAIDRLRARCTLMAGGSYADELIPVYGFNPEAVATLRSALNDPDVREAGYVTDDMVRAFAFGGTRQAVAERLGELGRLGVDLAILKLAQSDLEATRDVLARLGPLIKGDPA
ncbi:MAG: LLM class flavin-dependent oxidoreductase [Acidimicrobiia bacterium]|nr:LLM class flavin-dependent oxidoreductase [bacterium]MXZ31515.1 LLM class flavin-dependent oxidoreductase [Acidimicrobiia bacterium]MYB25127.1 LLM class flavin-dependent oxidoreductase [Acidimicrobiia bacterium]MYE67018.1 LLM class flavin-dependent oxidoreductase [Acidimicrobiia bacterium]MYJ12936.1 LLM class flavin-dependent oxidoreductase [Acidimicrobiia bacterium]